MFFLSLIGLLMMGAAEGHFEVQIQNRNLPIVYPNSNIRQYPPHHQTFPPPTPSYLSHYGQGGVYPIQHPFYRMGHAYPVNNGGPRFHQYPHPNQHQSPNQHGYKHTKEQSGQALPPASALPAGLAAATNENEDGCPEYNSVLHGCVGSKYRHGMTTWQQCARHCQQEARCRAWQWSPGQQECLVCTNSGAQAELTVTIGGAGEAVTGTNDCKPK